jgi:hypothetical protein
MNHLRSYTPFSLRTYHLFFVAVFLVMTSACSDGWSELDGPEFFVRFPGPPRDTATMQGNLAGVRVFYEPGMESIDENLYYAVSVYSLPYDLTVLNNLKEAMTADAKIYAWSMGGELAGEGKPVKSGTIDGYEYKVIMPSNTGTVTLRKFGLGHRMFTLIVITDNVHFDNPALKKFMDSFVLKVPKEKADSTKK